MSNLPIFSQQLSGHIIKLDRKHANEPGFKGVSTSLNDREHANEPGFKVVSTSLNHISESGACHFRAGGNVKAMGVMMKFKAGDHH